MVKSGDGEERVVRDAWVCCSASASGQMVRLRWCEWDPKIGVLAAAAAAADIQAASRTSLRAGDRCGADRERRREAVQLYCSQWS